MMELKELLDEASKLDGVCLQHQEIKVHSNGVKITLKKSYADDGLIDPSKSYTIVLIPEKEEKIIPGMGEFNSSYWELDPFLDLLRKASYQALLGIAKDSKPFHYDVGLIPGNVSGSALRVTFSDKWDQRILDSSVNPVYAQRLLGLIGLKGEFYSRSMVDNDAFHRLITDSLKKDIPVIARMTKAKREWDLIVGYKGDQFLRMNRGNYIQSIVPQLIYVIDVADSSMFSPPGSNTDETSYAWKWEENQKEGNIKLFHAFKQNMKAGAIHALQDKQLKVTIGGEEHVYDNGLAAYDRWIETLEHLDLDSMSPKEQQRIITMNASLFEAIFEARKTAAAIFHANRNRAEFHLKTYGLDLARCGLTGNDLAIYKEASKSYSTIRDFLYMNSDKFSVELGDGSAIFNSIKGLTDGSEMNPDWRHAAIEVLKGLKDMEKEAFTLLAGLSDVRVGGN